MGCPELFTISFRMMGSLLLWISIVLMPLDGCVSATAFNGSEWLLEISTVHCPPSHRCGVSSNNVNEQRQSASCCVECSCEDNCLETSNCCPYKETKSKQVSALSCKATFTKRSSYDRMIFDGLSYGVSRFRVKDDCPAEEKNSTLVKMCKGELRRELGDYIWISDTRTGQIYQNRHCAACHGIQDYTTWRIGTTCEEVMTMSTDNTEETIMSSDRCDVFNEPPSNEAARVESARCYIPGVDQCNVTGKWQIYDSEIERACLLTDWIYFDNPPDFFLPSIYRNLFCYICNTNTDPLSVNQKCRGTPEKRSGDGSSFVALIDFDMVGQPARTTGSKCQMNEVLDTYTVCRFWFI